MMFGATEPISDPYLHVQSDMHNADIRIVRPAMQTDREQRAEQGQNRRQRDKTI